MFAVVFLLITIKSLFRVLGLYTNYYLTQFLAVLDPPPPKFYYLLPLLCLWPTKDGLHLVELFQGVEGFYFGHRSTQDWNFFRGNTILSWGSLLKSFEVRGNFQGKTLPTWSSQLSFGSNTTPRSLTLSTVILSLFSESYSCVWVKQALHHIPGSARVCANSY